MDSALQWNVADSLDDGLVEDYSGTWNSSFYGRVGTVFLIECSSNMFTNHEYNGESFFELSLLAVKELILKQIRTRTKDSVGVVFYGTVFKDKPANPDNVTTFLEVKEPSADSILKIEEIIKLSRADFEKDYGLSSVYSIGDGLWHCSSLLRKCDFKFRSQKIVLVTCNDTPFSDPSEAVKRLHVRKRAIDLKQDKVDLQLLPFGESFDVSAFYQEVLQIFTDDEVSIPKNVQDLNDILPQILAEDCKPRCFGNMNFYLSKDLHFKVSAFKLFRKATMPTATKLDRVHNEQVKTVTRYREEETDEVMLPSELTKTTMLADERVDFSEAELKKLKTVTGKVGFQLLGFKPADAIKFHHYSQSSLFIIPTERLIKGSEQLFVTLRDCLLERNKVALGYMKTRRTAGPKLVYLMPQKEEIKDSIQILPDGFHVIFLPFAEQFRHQIPFNDVPDVSPDLEAVTQRMLKKIGIRYTPSMFQNPKLATFWAGLEALALNRNEVEAIDDLSNPDLEHIDERLATIATEFNHLVQLEQGPSKVAEKRPATTSRYCAKKKK